MSRPDYMRCIKRNHVDAEGKSWCGRNISAEFYFLSIDHAAENAVQGGRLAACKKCVEAACSSMAGKREKSKDATQ